MAPTTLPRSIASLRDAARPSTVAHPAMKSWFSRPPCRAQVVQVRTGRERKDHLQVGRRHHCGLDLAHREIADTERADVTGGPLLLRGPLDDVVMVVALLPVVHGEDTVGVVGAAQVDDDVHITGSST